MIEDKDVSQKINLFVLGNSVVGKTSFIQQYMYKEFSSQHIPTISVDGFSKNIILPSGKIVKLFIYDTAGQERYRSIAYNLVKSADGILLMYDITNKETFEAIGGWIESLKDIKGNDFPIILIGNKCDLINERTVYKEDGENQAKNNGFLFSEISCKNNINIEETIKTIVNSIIERKYENNSDRQSIKLDNKGNKKKKCIC